MLNVRIVSKLQPQLQLNDFVQPDRRDMPQPSAEAKFSQAEDNMAELAAQLTEPQR